MMLAGKVALVTGGSRGIGAAIVRQLAKHGADVAITYLNSADQAAEVVQQITTAGCRGLAIQADSADSSAIVSAVEQTVAELGGIDILVNNAGISAPKPIDKLTVADIDRMFAIHVRAVLLATQAAVRYMTNGGRIISIGSSLAERVPVAGMSLYAASKAALIGLTKGIARDVGNRGITAVVVSPGPTDTDLNPAHGPGADMRRARAALGRYSEPDDIAAAVVYLAGEGGRNITGTVITVDAGANA